MALGHALAAVTHSTLVNLFDAARQGCYAQTMCHRDSEPIDSRKIIFWTWSLNFRLRYLRLDFCHSTFYRVASRHHGIQIIDSPRVTLRLVIALQLKGFPGVPQLGSPMMGSKNNFWLVVHLISVFFFGIFYCTGIFGISLTRGRELLFYIIITSEQSSY